MNDADFEEQKARIQVLEKRWYEPLGLAAWRLNTVFVRSDFTCNGEPAPDMLAATKTDAEYMLATVSWNMPGVLDHGDRELERIFLHEMMHVMVNEMHPARQQTDINKALEAEDRWHEEHVCTMLGNAFLWTREAVLAEKAK